MIGSRRLNDLASAANKTPKYLFVDMIKVIQALKCEDDRLTFADLNRHLINTVDELAQTLNLLEEDDQGEFIEQQEQFWAQELEAKIAKQQGIEPEVIFNPEGLSEYELSSEESASSDKKREREAVVENSHPPKKAMTTANQGMFGQPRGNSRQAQQARLLAEANEFLSKPGRP